jgi:citronellyl-CoA synthetase
MATHLSDKKSEKSEKGEKLKFSAFLFGLISIFPRMPSIFLTLKEMMGFGEDVNLSLGSAMERNAQIYPDDTAILYEDRRYTHREFNHAINRYAHYFIGQGVRKNEVVVVLVDNRPELLMIVAALAKLGAVASLINPNLKGEVLRYSIDLTRDRHLIIGEELLKAFEEVRPKLKIGEGDTIYFQPETMDAKAPDGYINLQTVISAQSDENPATTSGVTINEPFAYVFTSGTTGLPKASIQTHRRWFMGQYWFGKIVMNLKTTDVLYCPLPFCHTNGLNVAWGSAAARGSSLVIRRKFSASHFLSDVRKYNATSFIYIGEICRYLMNQHRQLDDADNPLVSCVGNGLRPEIWTLFKERFGLKKIYELYGSAEGTLIFTNLLNLDRTVGTCLTPYAIVRYDIDRDAPVRNEEGFMIKVSPGEQGLLIAEISEKLPFAGYTQKQETEKKILRDVFNEGDMWFNFGDLVLNQGYKHIRFVDRLGDTFRWKGENVSTTEVEKVVNLDKQISASTVYGVMIPGTEGRAGMIAVIPDVPFADFDFKDFSHRIRRQLPSYAVPKFIRMKKEFETTGTHKIKKNTLREEGFDITGISDPLFVILPGRETYEALTPEIYQDILKGKYKF